MTKSENVSSKQVHMTGGKQENRISKNQNVLIKSKLVMVVVVFLFFFLLLDIELSIFHFIHIY